ncbi:MAG: fluoride efflux transporter CrcB [Niabella sp.]
MMKYIMWVALGGALGSTARFLISKWIASPLFPWGTFIVNITGCFLIGLLWAMSLKNQIIPDYIKLFLMTGLCGGFTTFSTFSIESISLLRDGKISLFLAYSLGSLLVGFLATFLAIKLLS